MGYWSIRVLYVIFVKVLFLQNCAHDFVLVYSCNKVVLIPMHVPNGYGES